MYILRSALTLSVFLSCIKKIDMNKINAERSTYSYEISLSILVDEQLIISHHHFKDILQHSLVVLIINLKRQTVSTVC